jgi:glycosyltransferase involved in cell wall biosynthesis
VIVVEDGDNQAFANAIVRLSSNREQRQALGNNAFLDAVEWNRRQMTVLANILKGK